MGVVKRDVDLDDAQIQSLMHQLRHEGQAAQGRWDEQDQARSQAALVSRLAVEVAADPTILPQRRAGLRRRLEVAATERVDPATLHAVDQLRVRAFTAQQQLRHRLRIVAAQLGLSMGETRAEFDRLRGSAPKGRHSRPSAEERSDLTGLPVDHATRYALAALAERAAASTTPPRRVVTHWTSVADQPPPAAVAAVGYDSESGRMEIRLADGRVEPYRNVTPDIAARARSGEHVWHTRRLLQSYPEHQYLTAEAATAAAFAVRCDRCGRYAGTPHTCPADPAASATFADGELVRLSTADRSTVVRLADPDAARAALLAHGTVLLPMVARIAGQPARQQSVLVDRYEYLPDLDSAVVRGDAVVSNPDDPVVDASALRCSCAQYAETGWCRHLAIASRIVAGELAAPVGDPRVAGDCYEQLAAAGAAGEFASAPWAGGLVRGDGPPAVVLPELPADISTIRYSDDPAAFADDVRAALGYAGGHPVEAVPLLPGDEEPAFYGYGAHRPFGVEVEYTVDPSAVPEFGSDWRDDSIATGYTTVYDDEFGEHEESVYSEAKGLYVTVTREGWYEVEREVLTLNGDDEPSRSEVAAARIGSDLYDAGVCDHSEQREYSSSQNDGYSSSYWSHEEDSSVAGEIVSPILRDRPETWAQLQQICQIVRGNGGTHWQASAHVHVSAPEFGGDPVRLARLMQLVREHEDDLYRMAHTPSASRDIQQWAAPVPPPPAAGYLDVSEARSLVTRYSAVNIGNVGDEPSESDHLEFRLFDASLDPGRMQAQIKLAAALVDYAARHPVAPAEPTRPIGTTVSVLGAGASRSAGVDLHPDATSAAVWAEHTAGVRRLIDRLFRRDVDKQQAAALWATGGHRVTRQLNG